MVPGGVVLVYAPDEDGVGRSHERVTRERIAAELAALKGFAFGSGDRAALGRPGAVYLVPAETLDAATARRLGIRGEDDLFGGVVPTPVVATKAITHPLVSPRACAPAGWSGAFGRRVRGVVLSGFTAFARDDARRAGALLLERGPVRLKPVHARGGRGQAVVGDAAALEAALGALDEAALAHGLVLEENLAEVVTYSVGQVRVAGLLASYWGTQRLTPDNDGAAVYGGSDLVVARGGFDALLALDPPEAARLAVAQARAYDTAAMQCFPGMLASRRNYDVAAGIDAAGARRCGVLEQSWRVGGASVAEIAALQAFRADPALRAVRAACVETYGGATPPPDATVYFDGVDDRVGPITKYGLAEAHADP